VRDKKKRRVIEILYTDRCPHLREALGRVRDAMSAHRATDAELRLVLIGTTGEASARRFMGSPTVRIDGEDVEPNIMSTMFGLHDRRYVVDGRVERVPPSDWIVRRLA
jgi:hypothetical protein